MIGSGRRVISQQSLSLLMAARTDGGWLPLCYWSLYHPLDSLGILLKNPKQMLHKVPHRVIPWQHVENSLRSRLLTLRGFKKALLRVQCWLHEGVPYKIPVRSPQ